MPCSRCQSENPPGARFCNQCGAGLAATCPQCGHENPPESRFCNGCGGTLPNHAATAASITPERKPRDYTPKHLAEKILKQKSAIEGERKQVTVLFADVKGSMDLQESLDAEDWHAIMNRFFQILADGVHRFEGTVNQYTGDGIMALFGAPIAHEDHAQRACYAALQLSQTLREYSRELRRDRGLDFIVRMGINSGEVVVGKIGDDLRMDYTAQGQTVGLAARMEALAEPGKVYLTRETARHVEGYFEVEDLGGFRVKGVSEPVPVFELRGVGALQTRFDLSRARGLTRFVGRDADLHTLESTLEVALRAQGRAVGIVADAGVGKSRLCFEFAERCRAKGITIIQASGLPHGKNLPLYPILQIFRAYFGIDEHDDARNARAKVAGRLLLVDEAFRETLPLVFEFLGIPDPKRPAPRMDAEARQRRLVSMVRHLIESGNPAGYLVLLEDLHWFDAPSDAFLAEWVDAVASGPGMLLLNFRPEYRAEWMQKSWYQQIPLAPLSPEAIRELLVDLIGADPSVEGLVDCIHERTRGNPYFTEEIVRSLVDSGVLEGSKGAYRLTMPVASIAVPHSVHAVLSARIDRLAEREKHLLQTAAVIGKEFPESILAAVAHLGNAELADSLSQLSEAEFIHHQAMFPVSEYAFAHPLTQEVALRSQLGDRRSRTHFAVAEAIQTEHSENLDEMAALLAHHYEEAGRPLEAARFHARAAAWVGTHDLDETLRHWLRVRELVRPLAESDETRGLRLFACLQTLTIGGLRLGISEEETSKLYEEGWELAQQLGNPNLGIAVRGAYGARMTTLGRIRESTQIAAETVELANACRDVDARAGPRVGAAYSNFHAGNFERVYAHCEEGIRITEGDLSVGLSTFGFSYHVWFVGQRGVIASYLGRLDEACRTQAEAQRLAHESGMVENLGWVRGGLATIAENMGTVAFAELGDAKAAALESLQIAEEMGSVFSRVAANTAVANMHLLTDEIGPAQRCLDSALALVRTRQVGLEFEALILLRLARAQRLAGQAPDAARFAEQSLHLARERGEQCWELQAHLELVKALCAEGDASAEARIRASLDRATELTASTRGRIFEPVICEARARFAATRGDAGEEERQLREARRLFVEFGATGHVARLDGVA